MEKCLHSRKNRNYRWFGLVGFFSIGLLLAILAGLAFQDEQNDRFSVFMCLLLYATGFVFCVLGPLLYIEQSREYTVDSSGITILYLKFYKVRYLWSDIGSVSVCDINHAPKDRNVFDVAIRIVVGQEKRGPFSSNQALTLAGYERWRTFGYGIVNFWKVIILDYSEDRIERIQKLSGKTIHDFRTVRARKT